MNSNQPQPFQFTEQIDSELRNYLVLNRMAVISLILGCASLLTLVILHMAWWTLPILGMVVGWIALRQITKNETTQSGKIIASLGFSLSLVLLIAAIASRGYRYYQANVEAEQVAATWIECMKTGRFQRAHQMTLEMRQRGGDDISLEEHYQEHPDWSDKLDLYLEREPMLTLMKWGEAVQIERIDSSVLEATLDEDTIELRYRVSRNLPSESEKSEPNSFELKLLLRRLRIPKSNSFYWQVRIARPEM